MGSGQDNMDKKTRSLLPRTVDQIEMSAIDHPGHYNQGNIEVIDFIEDQAHLGWNRQNAIKYICRSGAKESETKEQSIRKAIYYLERELGMHRKEIIIDGRRLQESA